MERGDGGVWRKGTERRRDGKSSCGVRRAGSWWLVFVCECSCGRSSVMSREEAYNEGEGTLK